MSTAASVKVEGGVKEDDIRRVVTNLLDKAGRDPRLTPKILRLKTESKLQVETGGLLKHRNVIKDIIWNWWEDTQTRNLQQLVQISKDCGLAPGIFKGLKELPTTTEKVETLVQRLTEKQFVFGSPLPSEAELQAALREAESRKTLTEVDPTLIIEGKRRRSEEGSKGAITVGSAAVNAKKIKMEPSSSSKGHDLQANEEAEF